MGLPSFRPAVLCDGQPRGLTATCRMGRWGEAVERLKRPKLCESSDVW